MIQGTTPTFKLQIDDNNVDLTTVDSVYATFTQSNYQGSISFRKTGADLSVSAHEVDVTLSQAETIQFKKGTLQIQLNWIFDTNKRMATDIAEIQVNDNLENGVLV